ncbi:chromosome condensation regulation protein [Chloropicon primus]|uniref:Chromosome condensation regulation protein n=1 Tax=Chloropicon primus TaxID=1764295 RepID=A0A5B8MEE4_9CHLO|nr:chromosome condensation regulation protein [Chloropicon primus]UPQ96927.1 chromosome condensation regulation protein [Chloropicon primus]|eukprot:QDZ17710.1 chromosome condensation regulation protein [Chloropicon primus]
MAAIAIFLVLTLAWEKADAKGEGLLAWGKNNAGQLGLGHTKDVFKPEFVPTFYPKKVKAFAAGGSAAGEGGFSLILTEGDKLYAFGCNEYGQLGVGDNEKRRSMTQVNVASSSSGERVVRVAAGDAFGVALTESGRVYSWGNNLAGQLGLGDVRDRNVPTLVTGNGLESQNITDIAAGSRFVVALSERGAIWTWGSNDFGQLGQGTIPGGGSFSSEPREIKGGALQGVKFSAVALGSNHTLALSRSGEIYAWGENDFGQLGLGDRDNRNKPFAVLHRFTRSRIQSIAAGAKHSMALSEKGEIFTFGSNDCDQLGYSLGRNSNGNFMTVPSLVDSVKGVRIHAGARVSMTTVRTGKVFVWGCNDLGQLGLGDQKPRPAPSLLPVSRQAPLLDFAISSSHTLAVNKDLDLLAWGRNANAELGLAYKSDYELSPKLVTSSTATITQLCTGGHAFEEQGHTICKTGSGYVFSWGWNAFGQLGLGGISKLVSQPSRLFGLEKPKVVRHFACGQYNTAAIVERNRMGPYTWGPNYSGQLGHSFFDLGPITAPKRMEMFKTTKFVQISSGYNHMLGLTEKGVLYVWGSNVHGQLGTGDTKDRAKPTQVVFSTPSAVKAIATGAFSSFAVTEDNTTFTWGYNEGLELGLGEGYNRNSPQVVHGLQGKEIVTIVCGAYHTFAVDSEKRVYGWGSNRFGQLGLGHTDDVLTPTLIPGLPAVMSPQSPYGIVTFSAGNHHSVMVSENGTMFAWGRNSAGQLGLGKEWVVVTSPTKMGDFKMRGVVAAASHTLAVVEVET